MLNFTVASFCRLNEVGSGKKNRKRNEGGGSLGKTLAYSKMWVESASLYYIILRLYLPKLSTRAYLELREKLVSNVFEG